MLQALMVGVLATKSSWQRLRGSGVLQGFALDTGLPALSGIPLSFPFFSVPGKVVT